MAGGKLSEERPFLYFIAYNPHSLQSRKLLTELLTPSQLTLLRELVINDLAQNLPDYVAKKRKAELYSKQKNRIHRLAQGKLEKKSLSGIFDYLQILCRNALEHQSQ